ncbi:lipoamide acyltransferase component of branched-chain alpha-keto acid dehydrogenase complex, mitochondrial [Halyomorpha halys]|uniref:lipoamide acyltransferase component of branched-chain alpha-keto acid dehydrogenase complex, mitochondrial n=1 Tax=Halyomorpha halys TaxID=286706 RepID=UPI0006D52349|nr:lipoamide acyltransferase component of branched-chain alpha-keto acid dehydrogenase complex, mitochondrial [Halyomorpha halys]
MILRILFKANTLYSSVNKVQFYRTSAVLLNTVQFKLSDIGEGIREVTVREWSVKVGDIVSQFDNICSVESDKATVNITSRYDGTITKLYYQVGEIALVGKPLVDIDVNEVDVPIRDPANVPPEKLVLENSSNTLPSSSSEAGIQKSMENAISMVDLDPCHINRTLATPAVRRIAKENNILLSNVIATGKKGRVLKEDILRHMTGNNDKDEKLVIEEKSFHKQTDTVQQIQGVRKVMIKTMTKSHSIPSFGYCDEINMSKLVLMKYEVKEYAKSKNINITYMPFFIKALSKALLEYPILNASLNEECEHIILKNSHNIGVAMDTKEGLIVPNIKNVEKLSIAEITSELNRLLVAGRESRLGPSDMLGGTITISNIGIIGGTYTRPLILPPEVCIVALGKTRLVPAISENGDVTKVYQMAASWTADHRIIDGATMARFSNLWKTYVENPNFLLLDL